MPRTSSSLRYPAVLLAALGTVTPVHAASAVRILLGQGDTAATDWSGRVTARDTMLNVERPLGSFFRAPE